MNIKRGTYGTIYRYMLKDFFVSFSIAFAFFFSIFFINEILTRVGDLLATGAPINKVIEVALFLMPMSIPFDIPFAVLVGALMSLGRMVSDREILVLRAGGISFFRLFAPALLLGIALSGVGIFFNEFVIPQSYGRVALIMEDILLEDPNVQITPYSITEFQDVKILAGDTENGEIQDLFIIRRTKDRKLEVLAADSGTIAGDIDNWMITTDLKDVYGLTTDRRQKENFHWFSGDSMEYNIFLARGQEASVWDIPGMTTMELWDEYDVRHQAYLKQNKEQINRVALERMNLFTSYWINSNDTNLNYDESIADLQVQESTYRIERSTIVPTRNAPYYGSEFYKKLALHISPLLFMFLAFPLGLRGSRRGKVQGFLVGIVISMGYWFLLYMSTVFVLFYDFPPFMSTWIGNIIIFLFGSVLVIRSVKR